MAYDGNGNFLRLHNWTQDAANNINISSSEMDGEDNGFATGLTNAVTRDGQGKMGADFTPATDNVYNLGTNLKRWLTLNGVPAPYNQTNIGKLLYPQTAAESSISLTPTNFWYPPGNVYRYGATGGGSVDDTAALQNATAQAAVGGNTAAQVFIPPGTYLTSAPINRAQDVYIVGAGPEFTMIKAAATFNGNIIQSAGTSSSIFNRGGIENLAIWGSWGVNNANTLSVGVSCSFTNRAIFRDLRIHGCYLGLYGIGVWQDLWENIQVDGAGTQQGYIGFYLDQLLTTLPSGTSNAVNAIHCTVQGISYCGFRLLNPNGGKFTGCEAENGQIGLFIGNTAAGCYPIEFFTCTGFLADTNSGYGIVVQQGANASPCTYIQFANCWTSTHGNTALYLDGCVYVNVSNHQDGNNAGSGMVLHNSQYCIIANCILQNNNTSNNAGIGDIMIQGGAYNKIIGNLSSMANSTSVSIQESAGTNNNTIADNTVFQGMTLIGSGTRAHDNQGYNPVGTSASASAGASPWTYTAGQSPETHYITQSATFTAVVSKGGKTLGTLVNALPMTVQLDPGGQYTVNWTTTAPTYVKDIH